MFIHQQKIGIWGLGIVGKATLEYFIPYKNTLSVMDKQFPNNQNKEFLNKNNITFYHENDLSSFFAKNDLVLASPGINHPTLQKYKHKLISELDLFENNYKKLKIAITGTVGKTTITTILGELLNKSMNISIGGNIGTGMLSLVNQQQNNDGALLELSSFQLIQSKKFAPDLAILTNFHPNHLDWHASEKEYFLAKTNIFNKQNNNQKALFPLNLITKLIPFYKPTSNWHFFTTNKKECNRYKNEIKQYAQTVFYRENNQFLKWENNRTTPLLDTQTIPEISFIENWLIICAALHLLKQKIDAKLLNSVNVKIPEHRLEKVTQYNGIDIYNDSKATTIQSTQAAINKLKKRPIVLILGGIDKGVDRTDFIKDLDDAIKLIICFGTEKEKLASICKKYNKNYYAYNSLEQAVKTSLQNATTNDQILFSPSGASFDQFKNYEERGSCFKKLVKNLIS